MVFIKFCSLLFEPGKANEHAKLIEQFPAFKKVTRNGEPVYECRLDIGTAGSTGLALQAILPFILFSKLPSNIPIHLTLTGGTNVSGSPSYEYITQVLLPTLQRLGYPKIEATLEKRGWSQGGSSIGSFTLLIPPSDRAALPAFRLSKTPEDEVGKRRPIHLRATFIAPQSCHQSFRNALLAAIEKNFDVSLWVENENLEIICESSDHEKRMYLILVATISAESNKKDSSQGHKLAIDWLYDRKIRSHERTAKEMSDTVASQLAKEIASGAAVDYHMRDQLVIYQALATGTSEVYAGEDHDGQLLDPSLHARTAEFVSKKMLKVTFDVEGGCEGVAFGVQEDAMNDSSIVGDLEERIAGLGFE